MEQGHDRLQYLYHTQYHLRAPLLCEICPARSNSSLMVLMRFAASRVVSVCLLMPICPTSIPLPVASESRWILPPSSLAYTNRTQLGPLALKAIVLSSNA